MARDNKFSGFSALRRFAQEETGNRAAEETVPEERCDLCGAPIPPDPDHRHLMEVATREISCVCRPCSILFDSKAALASAVYSVAQKHPGTFTGSSDHCVPARASW